MTFKAIAQLFVLGCSWGLGFFMVEEVGHTVGSVIAYLFTITNVLQGVLLFVVHCLLNRQVRLSVCLPSLASSSYGMAVYTLVFPWPFIFVLRCCRLIEKGV